MSSPEIYLRDTGALAGIALWLVPGATLLG